MIFRAALCVLLFSSAAARADEQVRRVQEELRKRNLYFGDVDGRKTAETRGAIRRYQERKGFVANGELNADTLRSLEIAIHGNVAEQWPDGTVIKSDAARQIAKSDRKLLEELIAEELAPPAEEPLLKPAEDSHERPGGAPDSAPKALDPVSLGPPQAGDLSGEVAEQTKAFVRDYLAACGTNRLDAELQFYADRVNYFDHGQVDRAFVARDVQRFYQRWPQREYELLDFRLIQTRGEEREVSFRIGFHYRNSRQSVAGRTQNVFKVRHDADGLHFTSLQEQRVRE